MLPEQRPCWKLNFEGLTLYVSTHDSKHLLGERALVNPGTDVKVEAPGFCAESLPAISLANRLLYTVFDSETLEIPLMGGQGETHTFLPEKYKAAPGPVYDVVSHFVEKNFTSYAIPAAEAKGLAAAYLESIRNRNPQDQNANNP